VKATRILATLFVCLTWMASLACAQGIGASGDIKGTVTDPQGSALSSAKVTVVSVDKGYSRDVTTDAEGNYFITGLSPAHYRVTAELSGFEIVFYPDIVVQVGETTTVDFKLKVSQVKQRVEVTGEPPIVETDRGGEANVITQKLIDDLPIDRRDYLTFTLLAPGVSSSVRIVDDQDFRVVQTPESGLSFYGSNGRGNSVTVDGGEANDDAGGVRLTVSQEAVQEFQINRTNYGTALGGSSGGNINIVTRSGSNRFHGSLFAFFRNDALDAQDPFSFTSALAPGSTFNPANPDNAGTPVKNSLSRQQFGGSLGGPIDLDKTFFFVTYEGLRESQQASVPLFTNTSILRPDSGGASFGGNNQIAVIQGLAGLGSTPVPCLSNPAPNPPTFLPASTCAGILNNILTVNPATSPRSAFLLNQFEDNSGVFPFTSTSDMASARLDHKLGAQDQLFFRFNFGRDNETNPNLQSLTGFSSGNTIKMFDNTLEGAWFHELNSNTQNEFRLQGNLSKFYAIPNTPGEAQLVMSGFASSLGTNIFLPSLTKMHRFEAADNITMIRGSNTVTMGADILARYNRTQSNTFFPGRFVFGSLPGGAISPCLQDPAANCGLTGLNPAEVNSLQSASLGLPQFYQQGFGDPNVTVLLPFYAGYFQDQVKVSSNFTFTFGLRYELDVRDAVNTYDKDFAPRAAFAWDPFKDHKTVVRGGFGIYYSPVYDQIDNVVRTLEQNVNNGGIRQISNYFVPLTGEPGNPALTSAAIFRTLFAQGKIQCTTPAAGQAACITPADLAQFGINVANNGPVPPLSVLFGAAPNYRNPYSMQGSLAVEHEFSPGFSISASGIYVDTRALPVSVDNNLLPSTPYSTVTSPGSGLQYSFQNWGSPTCAATPATCFANPAILQYNIYESAAYAKYYAGILEAKKRFSNHISIMGNYTWSRATDTTTDFNSDYGPQNQVLLGEDYGLSDFDERHKVVIAGVFTSPFVDPVLRDFEFNPIFNYNSGHPFNLLVNEDVNGDRHYTNDRPFGAPRNSGVGPSFTNVDFRLSRTFRVKERMNLQIIADAYNIANHTNYASINNIVGNPFFVGESFGATRFSGQVSSTTNSPLAFTSDFPKREIQLGARFTF